jgi:2-polyprenyl-6-methoxyphenol hydroxylase-like FAD-dependent oxidoreductase
LLTPRWEITMPTRTALISGASIAGPVLAYWLSEAGWNVTVVERAGRLRTSGYPIDVRGTAVEVVRRMGLYDEVAAQRYRHVPVHLLALRGRRLCTLDYGDLLGSSSGGDVELTRGALSEILHSAAADRVEYVFGDAITALSHGEVGVDVSFGHRPPETFDVVVGADGIHSNVRALAFGDEGRYLRHLGPYAAVWDLPTDMFDPGTGFLYSHPGRTVLVERPSHGAAARAFLTFVHPSPGTVDARDTDQVLRALHQAFAGDRWRTAEVIDTLPAADDVYFDTVSQVRMDRWYSGHVALVGDAAYAPAFLSGQGTSIAIAGAYVLASELVAHERPEEAFAAYQNRLRDYVKKNQDLALRTDGTVLVRTSGQLLRRNVKLCAVPLLQRLGLVGLLQTELRAAATDLTLSDRDLRGTEPHMGGGIAR